MGRPNRIASALRRQVTDTIGLVVPQISNPFFPMLIESVRVLEEGIVREPSDVDMGLILGIGFPPFRGGILRWCDALGAGTLLDRLAPFASLGKRYQPVDILVRQARTGEKFYPRPHWNASA